MPVQLPQHVPDLLEGRPQRGGRLRERLARQRRHGRIGAVLGDSLEQRLNLARRAEPRRVVEPQLQRGRAAREVSHQLSGALPVLIRGLDQL